MLETFFFFISDSKKMAKENYGRNSALIQKNINQNVWNNRDSSLSNILFLSTMMDNKLFVLIFLTDF